MSKFVWEILPYNGQEGQPCKYGCIMKRNKETGKIVLEGDCRAPSNRDCYLNIKDEEREDGTV